MLKVILPAVVALAFGLGSGLAFADPPKCTTGKPCGNSCIAKDKECHIPKAKECKTGKPCGDTCIAKDKTCTK